MVCVLPAWPDLLDAVHTSWAARGVALKPIFLLSTERHGASHRQGLNEAVTWALRWWEAASRESPRPTPCSNAVARWVRFPCLADLFFDSMAQNVEKISEGPGLIFNNSLLGGAGG